MILCYTINAAVAGSDRAGKEGRFMLKGKVAVVTGGTRGIGFEVVRKYLANGAKVVLFGSRQE